MYADKEEMYMCMHMRMHMQHTPAICYESNRNSPRLYHKILMSDICMYVCMYVYMYICIYVCVCMCVCMSYFVIDAITVER